MFLSRKRGARRQEIRKNRPDTNTRRFAEFRASGTLMSLWVAAAFFLVTTGVMMLREDVVPYHPGEYTPTDITARVGFQFGDKDKLAQAQTAARELTPRVYQPTDVLAHIEETLTNLPQRVAKLKEDELPSPLKEVLDPGSLNILQDDAIDQRKMDSYAASVKSYMVELHRISPIVLQEADRHQELTMGFDRRIMIGGSPIPAEQTYSNQQLDPLIQPLQTAAKGQFVSTLQPKIVALTIDLLKETPTHTLDQQSTIAAQNHAADSVPLSQGELIFNAGTPIVPKGEVTTKGWQFLRAENDAYLSQDDGVWKARAGTAATVFLITIILSAYVWKYQPRVVRNHARATAIAALMFSMLLLAQIAGVGSSPTFVFGIAPTILVAMIMTIAYDQRFACGVAGLHGVLVTLALNQSLSYFLVLWVGVLTCCFLLDDIRTRSKLIEVGGLTAIALILATCAAGLINLLPPQFMFRNCLYAGAAGLGVGFVVLGILPFVEKIFRITTGMTLLELADTSQPLLRRLSMEAPGTYSHSLQVATLSEEAAEAIGGNSLLCRVGAFYHDIGKINKADYFIENQTGGESRHINLSPNVSLLIIIGHVKDGVEMAKEYNLPTSLLPFIQQHHGTTLVEYFYHRACDNCAPDEPKISDTQFRYPGPKPKSKEIAIVMLSDAVESATRAMEEPTASRIETLVHELALKRLMDGQFDECDMTMRDLERIERSLAKTLLSFYHGRIAYPSTQSLSAAPSSQQANQQTGQNQSAKSA